MKILLVYPPKEGEVPESLQPSYVSYDFSNFPPMGILAIAANVDPRHDLKVLDCLTRKMSIAFQYHLWHQILLIRLLMDS